MNQKFSIILFLEKVRDHVALSENEITTFIKNMGHIPDEQLSAFLAHAYHQPLSKENRTHLTLAMRDSGIKLNWQGIEKPIVDKHSTGGVGDKVTICLGPLVAALGMAMPTISGRGLGHTGGTLDKLESISGLSTEISPEKIQEQVKKWGLVFAGQTKDIVPADRKLYALRDITATVNSLPLITVSILSKKLAESLDSLILDVKWGSGALMNSFDDAKKLAMALVETANLAGTPTRALITNMNQPLGQVSGNFCEVAEAVDILKKSKNDCKKISDTRELTIALTAELLLMNKICKTQTEATSKIESALASGKPFEIFCQVIAEQGGDAKIFEKDYPTILETKHKIAIKSPKSGIIQSIQTKNLGLALVLARAGRQKQGEAVAANTSLHHPHKIGATLKTGDTICTLFTDDNEKESQIRELLEKAFQIGEAYPSLDPLIKETMTEDFL